MYMATKKPMSNISYNTEPFLKEKLDFLVSKHILEAYAYIKHIGEEGDKDHIHLICFPNQSIDFMDISEMLKEPDPNNTKPLGVLRWRPSKEEHWLMYAVHDKEYLDLKYNDVESTSHEKIPYTLDDIVTSDGFMLERSFIRAKQSIKHTQANIAKRLQDGAFPLDLIMEGENVHTINALTRALSVNDYKRLQNAFAELESKYTNLYNAVIQEGYLVYTDKSTKRTVIKRT